jgi:DNA-binding response OmpR family regulator
VAALKRILYVDGDAEARLLMRDLLLPHTVDLVGTDAEAKITVRQHSYDLYILAGGGPASSAIALCEWLQRTDGRTPIVFCSSNATPRYQQAAIAAGAVRFLVKPLEPALLRSTLSLLLKLAELESARAMASEEQAIHEALIERSLELQRSAAGAREKAQHARDCMLRAKAYRAFREAGGNRANFERMWPAAIEKAQGSTPPAP